MRTSWIILRDLKSNDKCHCKRQAGEGLGLQKRWPHEDRSRLELCSPRTTWVQDCHSQEDVRDKEGQSLRASGENMVLPMI
jgi:hypothetical protein